MEDQGFSLGVLFGVWKRTTFILTMSIRKPAPTLPGDVWYQVVQLSDPLTTLSLSMVRRRCDNDASEIILTRAYPDLPLPKVAAHRQANLGFPIKGGLLSLRHHTANIPGRRDVRRRDCPHGVSPRIVASYHSTNPWSALPENQPTAYHFANARRLLPTAHCRREVHGRGDLKPRNHQYLHQALGPWYTWAMLQFDFTHNHRRVPHPRVVRG